MRVNNFMRKAIAAAIMSAVGGATQAAVLEEVVVTAQKREQNVQDVGISITAMTGEAMEALGMDNTQEITQQVPGLQLQTWSPQFTIFNLRGVSQNNFTDNLEAPVAVYFDDVYVSSMNAIGQQMYDMERVEVLRGPQGTLFGRNATGGLVHYLSRKATDSEFNGYLKASYSSFDTYELEGAVGGAFTERARGRLAARWEQSDGYVEAGSAFGAPEASGRDSAGADGYSLRGSLQFDLSDSVMLDLITYYSKDEDVPTGQYVVTFSGFDGNTGLGAYTDAFFFDESGEIQGPTTFPQEPITGDVHEHFSDQDPFFDRETTAVTANLGADLGNGMELTWISNWTDMDKFYIEDAGGGLVFFPFITTMDFEQWSQELRLSGDTERSRWQVGAYLLDISMEGLFSVEGAAITGFPGGLIESRYEIDSENWSIFGQYEYDLTETLTMIAGYRWSQDDKSVDFAATAFNLDVPDGTVLFDIDEIVANDPSVGDINEIDYGDYAARLQLNWEPNLDTLVFVSYNRGIKGGNWSINQDVNVDNFRHDEEVLHSYEVGLKSTFADGTVRFNATAFYYDYQDYQAFNLTNLVPQVANSDATVQGGELELFLTPNASWDIILGASFIDSEVESVEAPFPGATVEDAELPNAPEISLNGLVRYNWEALGGEMSVQLDGVWNDDQYIEGTNSEVSFQESYGVANARATYVSGDGSWELSGWVKNLNDEEYLLYNLDLGLIGFVEQHYGPPRWYGVTATYKW